MGLENNETSASIQYMDCSDVLAREPEARCGMKYHPNQFVVFRHHRSLLLVYMVMATGVIANPATAMGIASAKTSLTFMQAFTRGVLCNWLVCMAGTYLTLTAATINVSHTAIPFRFQLNWLLSSRKVPCTSAVPSGGLDL